MMAQSQMQRDVLELNMEDQLNQIAGQKYGKTMAECSDKELYYTILDYTKELTTVTEKLDG